MDYIYISRVHVAGGVHHCTSKYIYRVSGGFATQYQLANLPTDPHFAPGGTSPAPLLNWPISPPCPQPPRGPQPGPPTCPGGPDLAGTRTPPG